MHGLCPKRVICGFSFFANQYENAPETHVNLYEKSTNCKNSLTTSRIHGILNYKNIFKYLGTQRDRGLRTSAILYLMTVE